MISIFQLMQYYKHAKKELATVTLFLNVEIVGSKHSMEVENQSDPNMRTVTFCSTNTSKGLYKIELKQAKNRNNLLRLGLEGFRRNEPVEVNVDGGGAQDKRSVQDHKARVQAL